jgi:hypothetical protein
MGRIPIETGVTHPFTAMVSREHGLLMVQNKTPETTIPYVLSIHDDAGRRLVGVKPDGSVDVEGDQDEASGIFYDALGKYGQSLKTQVDRLVQENADLRMGLERIVNEVKAQSIIRDVLARKQWEAEHPPQKMAPAKTVAKKKTAKKTVRRKAR